MTSLKDVNKSVNTGTEELEELNQNFRKWFELQKRNRLDDLENSREMKRAMKAGAGGAGAGAGKSDPSGGLPPWLLPVLGGLGLGLGITTPGFIKTVRKNAPTNPKKPVTPKGEPKRNSLLQFLEKKLEKLRIKNLNAAILEQERIRQQRNANSRATSMQKYGSKFNQYSANNAANLLRRVPYGPQSGFNNRMFPTAFPDESNRANKYSGKNTVGFKNTFKSMGGMGTGVTGETARGAKDKYGGRGERVFDKNGKSHLASSPRGKMIVNMRAVKAARLATAAQRMGGGISEPYKAPTTIKSKSPVAYKTPQGMNIKGGLGFKQLGTGVAEPSRGPRIGSLMGSGAAVGTALTNNAKGYKGLGLRLQNPPARTGNIVRDIKNMIKARMAVSGGTQGRFIGGITKFVTQYLGKALAVGLAFQFWQAMTGPRFDIGTMSWLPELSKNGKIEYAASFFTGFAASLTGASVGAALGSIIILIPGVGTLVGGLIGGYVFYLYGAKLGAFVARYLLGLAPESGEVKAMKDAMAAAKAKDLSSSNNKMIRMNASTQRELGGRSDVYQLDEASVSAKGGLTGFNEGGMSSAGDVHRGMQPRGFSNGMGGLNESSFRGAQAQVSPMQRMREKRAFEMQYINKFGKTYDFSLSSSGAGVKPPEFVMDASYKSTHKTDINIMNGIQGEPTSTDTSKNKITDTWLSSLGLGN